MIDTTRLISEVAGDNAQATRKSVTTCYLLPIKNWPELLQRLYEEKKTGAVTLNISQGTLASVQFTEKTNGATGEARER